MVRLHLTVEGPTEQKFVLRVLQSHLATLGVDVPKPRCVALCEKKGRVHRGGMARYEPFKKDLCRWLKQYGSDEVFFSTMVDLYRLPRDFPAYEEASRAHDPYWKVRRLENAFEEDIGDRRFIAYIQLHEFETLLFADPAIFGAYFPECGRQIANLVQIQIEVGNPELIDDGEQSAPSKRIGKEIPEYLGVKPLAGPLIAQKIGLEIIRAKCRHFHEWVTKLEQLGAKS